MSHRLASLRLAALQIRARDLVIFVNASPLTPKNLRLADIILLESDQDSWKKVITKIAWTLKLDKIEIGGEFLSIIPGIATPLSLSLDYHAANFEEQITIGKMLGVVICSGHLAAMKDDISAPNWVKQFLRSSSPASFDPPLNFLSDILEDI